MSYGAPFPGDDWFFTAESLKTGTLRIDEGFIFRRFQLSEAEQAFALFKSARVDGKVMFIMPDESE